MAKAFQGREEADYEPLATFEEEEFGGLFDKARTFIEDIKGIINTFAK
ncbi:MAG: hypothetical protein ACE5PM_07415 [Candidatus Hydrothermarchaeales archaeon]